MNEGSEPFAGTGKRRFLSWMAGVFFVLGLSGCVDSLGSMPQIPTEPTEPGAADVKALATEGAEVTDALLRLARQVVVIPFPGGSLMLGFQNGWWSVRVVMFGSDRSLQVRFEDADGQQQNFYHPILTRTIRIRTVRQDVRGLLEFGVAIAGVEFGAESFRISGNGRYQNRQRVWFFYLNRVTLAKVGNPYPLRGQLVLEAPHDSGSTSTMTLQFNGSHIVDGTIESGSVTVSFTLNLISLVVSGV